MNVRRNLVENVTCCLRLKKEEAKMLQDAIKLFYLNQIIFELPAIIHSESTLRNVVHIKIHQLHFKINYEHRERERG